jgi:MoxR-like ATPase
MKRRRPARASLNAPIDCRSLDETHRRVAGMFRSLSALSALDRLRVVPSPTRRQLTPRRACSRALDKFRSWLRRHSVNEQVRKFVSCCN